MNYKLVEYRCGCKYIWLNETKRLQKCPEHNSTQKAITIWCLDCDAKMIVTPLSGQKIRCYECSKYKNKKINRAVHRKKP